MSIELHNVDCMEYMRELPDNAFELAIVDPPYGIKMHGGVTYQRPSRPNSYGKPPKHEKKDWDKASPTKAYWDELFRVAKNQIVWGANYFTEYLPPSMGWIYWAKMEDASNFSDGELAYTSYNRALRTFKVHQFDGTNGGKHRIHPTQKPVKLYDWLLMNYAKEGDRILDTHLGSGSSAIAAHNCGFDFVGCELDTDYFNAASKRLKQHQAQLTIPID
jgi:site-specific DNA-methyltransferase (adenine-specific)